MGIKRADRLLELTPGATGIGESKWVAVDNFEDFIFVLRMGDSTYLAAGGSSSDTIDVWIETSSTDDVSQSEENYRALDLVDPADNTISKQFDQVEGGLTFPADPRTASALRQQRDYKSPNVDQFVRARYTVAGTPANLGVVILDMYSTQKT